MRILMILHNYPPATGPDVARGARFADSLSRLGHEVDVLTSTSRGLRDFSQYTRQTRRVYRVPALIPSGADVSSRVRISHSSHSAHRLLRSLVLALKRFALPDRAVVWALLSTLVVLWIALRRRYDAVYSSFYPGSCHLLGLVYRQLIPRVSWIADFRDSWMSDPTYRRRGAARLVNRALESATMRRLDAAIFATDSIRAKYIRDYPRLVDKSWAIYNGYNTRISDDVNDARHLEVGQPLFAKAGQLGFCHRGLQHHRHLRFFPVSPMGHRK